MEPDNNNNSLPLDLIVAIWRLGEAELLKDQNQTLKPNHLTAYAHVVRHAREWVRDQKRTVRNTSEIRRKMEPIASDALPSIKVARDISKGGTYSYVDKEFGETIQVQNLKTSGIKR